MVILAGKIANYKSVIFIHLYDALSISHTLYAEKRTLNYLWKLSEPVLQAFFCNESCIVPGCMLLHQPESTNRPGKKIWWKSVGRLSVEREGLCNVQ